MVCMYIIQCGHSSEQLKSLCRRLWPIYYMLHFMAICKKLSYVAYFNSSLLCEKLFFQISMGLFLQVFMLLSSAMFVVDVIWGVCNWSALSDSFICLLFAHLSWILHHLRAPFSNRASNYCCTWMCILFNSGWLQSFCTLFHCKFLDLVTYFAV